MPELCTLCPLLYGHSALPDTYPEVEPHCAAMERVPGAQPCLDRAASVSGLEFPHMFPAFKSRKGLKRCEDGKDTYKLPHRLIEKKRRDRINECIAQLKDLLPEHLKLTTLGHLEKAVVLELTLKHVQSLSGLIEQQQQQILNLQNGCTSEAGRSSGEESMFRSGYQLCADEALRFLQGGEKRELVAHLHRVASDLTHGHPCVTKPSEKPAPKGQATNCVPVIRRAAPLTCGEQSGTDTDTDSGYGGELDKVEGSREHGGARREVKPVSLPLERIIKQEEEESPRKRPRMEDTEDDIRVHNESPVLGPYPSHPPFCMPFYFIPPSASTYLPMLEKCWYPGSMPMLYPNLAQSGLMSQDQMPPIHSPPSMDSSALMQALKQVPPVGTDPKD